MVQLMANSKLKTTTAVLREVLGPEEGGEKRFAALASRSVSWVKKVSAGLEPLTEEIAYKLQAETGVDVEWLLQTKPSTPPTAHSPACGPVGTPYTYATYEAHRALIEIEAKSAEGEGRQNTSEQLLAAHEFTASLKEQDMDLIKLCQNLLEQTELDSQASIIRYRLRKLVAQLAEEFINQERPATKRSSKPSDQSKRGSSRSTKTKAGLR
jgi:hypothetical protein